MTNLFLLHTVVVLLYTHDTKVACFVTGGTLSKRSEIIYHKSLLVANFVQTYTLISIYNDIYTVCSYDTPQCQVRLNEHETEQV